jgi:RNA polymerase sigma-70 factor (ECF subfamily)
VSTRRARLQRPTGAASSDLPSARTSQDDPAVDQGLLERIGRGDHAALAELYDRHCTAAYTLALVVGGDRSTAAALVHDTFLAVWTGEAGVPGQGAVRGWLLSVLGEKGKQVRDGGGRRRGALREELLRRPVVSQDAEPDLRKAVTDAVATLGADEVEVVVLAMRCGLATGQIADLVGLSQARVGTLLNRGLRALTSVTKPRFSEPQA